MKLANYEWDPELDLIAEGGFAEVFKAKDVNTENRFVALKIYKEAVSKGTRGNTGQKKYSLEQEFAKVDGLSHTNLVSYFGLDYLRHDDAMGRTVSYPVLIMEYAGEGTLNDLLEKNPSDTAKEKIIREIASAVEYLHQQGIIHRDLKPGNILFSRDRAGKRVAKVTDFGISQDTLTEKTQEETFTEGIGTPNYMAPEQFYKRKFGLSGEISERTDIWALGVIMYKSLSGEMPFGKGGRDNELIREEIISKEPDYSKIPAKYIPIIQKCLMKNAEDRFKSVADFMNSFDQELGTVDATLVNTPSSPYEKPKKTGKKILVSCIVALVLIIGGYYFYRQTKINSLLAEGWDSYKTINYEKAYDSYLKAAEYDSGEAYYFLSMFNMFGHGIDVNYEKANELTDKAIEAGYDMANFQHGWSYLNELGVAKDSAKAKEYFEKSLSSIKKLSREGNPEAQNLYGILSLGGLVVQKDIEQAKKYYDLASKKGHLAAIENLASLNKNDKKYKEAFEGFEKCMKVGRYSCYRNLGDMYRFGQHVEKDTVKALELYTHAANNKDLRSQYLLGSFHLNGNIAKKDRIKAIGWYTKAAERGHINAQNDLGTIYFSEKKYNEGEKWFLKAVEKGNAYAAYNMGLIYHGGLGRDKDYEKAKNWFINAAKKNHRASQYRLGLMFENGEGVQKNSVEAKNWYSKSAKNNYAAAQHKMGGLAYEEKNYENALEWYSKSANQDYSSSQNMLGVMNEMGLGAPKDLIKAKSYYETTSQKGNSFGQYNLGNLYYYGKGVEKDIKKAEIYYTRAANQDNSGAQYMLGYIYASKNYYYLAKKWYAKAAMQGHSDAQNSIGILYGQGKLGRKDYKKALEYFEQSAENGNKYGKYNLGLYHFYGNGTPINKRKAKILFEESCNDGHTAACTKLRKDY